ncbi:glutamyl-tRNA reductase [Alicyclobacillus acidocaldarius]|uniref:Glutamyl-tRNA reductase n=1 Tax=Alicyclobacillus acidocaldarius subsp. acidocaldarius (strain ATCC 27009 / DSM 446 / BCRC 14685 / JCM 5260 / KCTC 1825 / NBRC 15652 / NCIMB 11725 / NRRL B-14509 / 104-IA) TaxID=521098 RepID=C8WXN1_ALIAD|nr:glutamyl-tRNA reductase [Alicyclobacillus acidocaldarius]ACV58852.1 glutamyl-tRNA reductase [Alicyclobacillus acidocaldarius subsp. acidocaldarius DSM 446]
MNIFVVGLSHKTAPVELRERVSLGEAEVRHVLTQLRDSRTVLESVVVSTCNRLEIYGLGPSARAGSDFALAAVAKTTGVDRDVLWRYAYVREGEDAVRRGMRVACGIDSVVFGETQILGQMRDAYHLSLEEGATGSVFNRLFREIIHVGKRAQTETSIGREAVSVSYAAVQLARKVLGELHDKQVVVIGAGHMAGLAARHFGAQQPKSLLIFNRTLERAQALAAEVGGGARPLDEDGIAQALAHADVVLTAIGRGRYVVTREMVASAMMSRRGRPLVILDIAVPRDVDPEVSSSTSVYLYDVDDLEGVVAANLEERARQEAAVEAMIDEGVRAFSQWLAEQEVVPVIAALHRRGEAIEREVMASLLRKLPHLTERDQKVIHKHMMSIVHQLLREPVKNVKELSLQSGDPSYAETLAALFGLEPETSHNRVRVEWGQGSSYAADAARRPALS